ncbi:MAG TPA: hypothetical protein VI980_01960 [Acidimicrobiia bacterium]|nr:hypothetical protein [Acidimicrobiia bacterium]
MTIRRIAMALGLTTILVLSATPAMAATPDPERREQRLDMACARVPNLTTRVENVLARINGDAETRGSIAWLETKAEQARENGREQLAEFIENRIAVRTERIDVLEIRLDNLAEAAVFCQSRA